MSEYAVTVEKTRHRLAEPFLVVAKLTKDADLVAEGFRGRGRQGLEGGHAMFQE